jgi:hypothetical protein
MSTPAHLDLLQRLQTYEVPPVGFDPRTAAPASIQRYGFPRRPDPQKEPEFARLWEHVFALAPRLQMVKAELTIDPVISRRHRAHLKTDFGESGWAGVVVPTKLLGFSPYEPANTVFAQWVVPPVPPEPVPFENVGFWVGLDGGLTGGQHPYGLLQAGTAATIRDGVVVYYAWTEWYTDEYKDPPVVVKNFAVQPGDLVSFLVSTPQPNQGFVSMMNFRTQQATSVGIPARKDIPSVGARAEWIVEAPTGELPFFLPVVFANATAGTQHHSFNLSPHGQVRNITSSGGVALTQTVIISPTTLLVAP